MEQKNINNEKGLFKSWLFWITLVAFFVAPALIYTVFTIYENNLSWMPCFTDSCINKFSANFGPLVVILQLGIAVIVLYSIGFRTAQSARQADLTREQISLTRTINSASQYLEHRKAFIDLLNSMEKYNFKFTDKNAIYSTIFSHNSPQEFDPRPATGDEGPHCLEGFFRAYNAVKSFHETLIDRTDNLTNTSQADTFHFLRELNLLVAELRIEIDDKVCIRNELREFFGVNPVVPRYPMQTAENIRVCLEHIRDFSVPPSERNKYCLNSMEKYLDNSFLLTNLLEGYETYE